MAKVLSQEFLGAVKGAYKHVDKRKSVPNADKTIAISLEKGRLKVFFGDSVFYCGVNPKGNRQWTVRVVGRDLLDYLNVIGKDVVLDVRGAGKASFVGSYRVLDYQKTLVICDEAQTFRAVFAGYKV